VALIPHRYGKSLAKVFDPKSPRSYAQAIEKDQTIDKAVRQKPINPVLEYLNIYINLLFFLRPELNLFAVRVHTQTGLRTSASSLLQSSPATLLGYQLRRSTR
jgi:hypothetical protein